LDQNYKNKVQKINKIEKIWGHDLPNPKGGIMRDMEMKENMRKLSGKCGKMRESWGNW